MRDLVTFSEQPDEVVNNFINEYKGLVEIVKKAEHE